MTQQQKKIIRAGSANISYRMAGKGQPIIFIHGFPFTQHMWDAQFESLGKTHCVITYDQRGFGNSSSGGDEKLSIDLLASDLKNLLDALNIQKCVACGLSMGGYVLMNAVSRFPELFSAIVLADTQCIADSEEGKKKRSITIDEIESQGLEHFAEGYVTKMFCSNNLKSDPTLGKRTKEMILSNRAETVKAGLQALAERKETCNALKHLEIPALVICGNEDQVTPRSQSELIFNSITGAKLQIIENAAHLSAMEQPGNFNALIMDFLRQI